MDSTAASKNTDGGGSSKTTHGGSSHEHDDPYGPYYLNHTDNSTSGAVAKVLDGNNFHTWHNDFRMSLKLRNKLGFIDGSLPMPENDDSNSQRAWIKCNTLILSWLQHSVTPDIKSTIMYCETAQEAYERLRLRYAEPSDIRAFQLEQDLNAVVQNNMTVGEYFTKLNCLWEELKIGRAHV